MNFELLHLIKKLTGKSPYQLIQNQDNQSIISFLAGLMDEGHVIVLNALTDELSRVKQSQVPETASTEKRNQLVKSAEDKLNNLRRTLSQRLSGCIKTWTARFEFNALYPPLNEDGLFNKTIHGYCLSGKASKKKARYLYQQTVQDLVVEGIRIFSYTNGSVFQLQENIIRQWHRETVKNNFSKLRPLFEASIRAKETSILKSIRISLSDKMMEAFIQNVLEHYGDVFDSELSLFKHIGKKWYQPGINASGLVGFLYFFCDSIRSLSEELFDWYEEKWALFFDNLKFSAGSMPDGHRLSSKM